MFPNSSKFKFQLAPFDCVHLFKIFLSYFIRKLYEEQTMKTIFKNIDRVFLSTLRQNVKCLKITRNLKLLIAIYKIFNTNIW